MTTQQFFIIGLLSTLQLLAGCDKDPLSQKGKVNLPATAKKIPVNKLQLISNVQASDIKELEWEDLIPTSWRPDSELVFKYNNGEIDDKDPRIIALRKKMEQLQKLAPVNNSLDGLKVKIPGFVVPLEGDGKKVSEFLLVPYHGACVHVPPPPANQIVYVRSKPTVRKLMETVWVTGTLKIAKIKNQVAEANYTLHADKIETYE